MYKATILDKEFTKGMLSVTVKFNDEAIDENIVETFSTNQDQPAEWLEEQIDRKLNFLNKLKESVETIEVSAEFEAKSKESSPDKEAQAEFIADVEKLRSMKRFVDLGVLESDNADYLALQAKIKSNFKTEYIGLI